MESQNFQTFPTEPPSILVKNAFLWYLKRHANKPWGSKIVCSIHSFATADTFCGSQILLRDCEIGGKLSNLTRSLWQLLGNSPDLPSFAAIATSACGCPSCCAAIQIFCSIGADRLPQLHKPTSKINKLLSGAKTVLSYSSLSHCSRWRCPPGGSMRFLLGLGMINIIWMRALSQ